MYHKKQIHRSFNNKQTSCDYAVKTPNDLFFLLEVYDLSPSNANHRLLSHWLYVRYAGVINKVVDKNYQFRNMLVLVLVSRIQRFKLQQKTIKTFQDTST